MTRKLKIYDVDFTLEWPACLTVEAHSEKEAIEIVEDELCNMDQEELIERLLSAAEGGLKVTYVRYVDDVE